MPRPWRRAIAAGALVAACAPTSCLLLRDVDALSSGIANDADAEAATAEGAPDGDASTTGDSDAAPLLEGGCPGTAGPVAVRVGTECIDSTEVTVKDYRTFLNAIEGAPPAQATACASNTFPRVSDLPGTSADEEPVDFVVDWCDAVAFCTWAGKRLCGGIGGVTLTFGDVGNPLRSQWFAACSKGGDGHHAYPYGNTYAATACNGVDGAAPVPVGSKAGCEGGYPGVFDLSGNVREWEDACETTDGVHKCLARGGAWYDNPDTLMCGNTQVMDAGMGYHGVGFRCCSP